MAFASKCSMRIPFPTVTTDKQHYENYKEIQRWADRLLREDEGCLGSGGKPYATFVIAASNSTAADAANADYVCDGTDDQVEIQAAIDALPQSLSPSGANGGLVLLLEGAYIISSAIDVDANNCWLRGVGPGTTLDVSGGTSSASLINLSGDYTRVSDMQIRDNFVQTNPTTFVLASGDYVVVSDLLLRGGPSGSTYAIQATGGLATIRGCISATARGIRAETAQGTTLIHDNLIWNSANTPGILVGGADAHHQVIRNTCRNGDSINGITVSGGDDHLITGNICRNNGGYGIEIEAGASDCIVVGNDLRGNTTGSLLDSGTSTILEWPNDATIGDNFG